MNNVARFLYMVNASEQAGRQQSGGVKIYGSSLQYMRANNCIWCKISPLGQIYCTLPKNGMQFSKRRVVANPRKKGKS